MKVYISGPIKGVEDYAKNFRKAEAALRSLGHETVNPVTIVHKENATYEDFMRADILAMLDCEAIYLLRGWEKSQGAKVEFMVATACGFQVWYE